MMSTLLPDHPEPEAYTPPNGKYTTLGSPQKVSLYYYERYGSLSLKTACNYKFKTPGDNRHDLEKQNENLPDHPETKCYPLPALN